MVFALHYTEKNKKVETPPHQSNPFHLSTYPFFLYSTQTKQYISHGKERKKGMVSIYE
jgi:hypothetical protein